MKDRIELTPWQRHALTYLRRNPDTTLPGRGALVTGARGLVRLGLASVTGIPSRYTLTTDGVAEYGRREALRKDTAA